MGLLRDNIMANADPKQPKSFFYKMSPACQVMIAEALLMFRRGEIPMSLSELDRSLQRIAETQYQEDYAKWPDRSSFSRFSAMTKDHQLQEIIENTKTTQAKKPLKKPLKKPVKKPVKKQAKKKSRSSRIK
jgi:hypothetical protein